MRSSTPEDSNEMPNTSSRGAPKSVMSVVPCSPEEPSEAWPDLMERLTRLYPEGPICESAAEQLYRDRDGIDSNAST